MRPLRDKVISYMDKWMTIIGIEDWDVHVRFYQDKKTICTAFANTEPQYLEIWVSFNTSKLRAMDDTELEKLVLHELCHAHTASLTQSTTGHKSRKMISYLDEMVTSAFAHALWRAYRSK